jgi:hypothetical protein
MGRNPKTLNDDLIKKLRKYNTSAEDITITRYAQNISKLYRDLGEEKEEYKPDIFFKPDDIFEELDKMELSNSTYKNKLSAIITFLMASGVDKKIVSRYTDKLYVFSSKIERGNEKMQWNDKESKNKLTIKELHEYLTKKEKELPKEPESYEDLYKWMLVVSGLTHISFPMRNELADVELYSALEFSKIKKEDDVNYFVITPKLIKVYINKYKTKKSKDGNDIHFDIKDPLLVKLYNRYFKILKHMFPENHFMLFKKDGHKMTRNDFTRLLNDCFKGTGKKISSSLIRKIVLSELYPVEKIKTMSYIMGNTPKVQLSNYVKS